MAEQPDHRHRVGGVGTELTLVDVDARPGHGVAYMVAEKGMLYEDAAYLAVAAIDVVGPFHHRLHAAPGKGVGNGERDSLADEELAARMQRARRTEEKREGKVTARLRLPAVAPLTASRALAAGRDHRHVGEFTGMLCDIGICRGRLLKFEIVHR